MIKPGYRTSEFWLTVVSFIFSGAYLVGVLDDHSQKEDLISETSRGVEAFILIMGQLAVLFRYIKGRTEVKKTWWGTATENERKEANRRNAPKKRKNQQHARQKRQNQMSNILSVNDVSSIVDLAQKILQNSKADRSRPACFCPQHRRNLRSILRCQAWRLLYRAVNDTNASVCILHRHAGVPDFSDKKCITLLRVGNDCLDDFWSERSDPLKGVGF